MNKYILMTNKIIEYYEKIQHKFLYKIISWIFGIFTLVFVKIYDKFTRKNKLALKRYNELKNQYTNDGTYQSTYLEIKEQLKRKNEFFSKTIKSAVLEKKARKISESIIGEKICDELRGERLIVNSKENFYKTFKELLQNKLFFIISLVVSLPLYLLIAIYSAPYIKYILERLVMLVFVLIGVTIVVFTIIYFSPLDPARNVIGVHASEEQLTSFRNAYGLNESYPVQLFNTVKKLASFDMGKSFVGNENVTEQLQRRFPVTINLGILSMIIAVLFSIPAGIISAIKQYSAFDYIVMFMALIGLSIPTFWLGLILILQFSINLQLLPATFEAGNWLSMIMPAFVYGVFMMANIARMTRSSMLEVKKADYIITARAKGINERKVIIRHILKNALIPIVTIVGLQFASTLGGAVTIEKVFNINGIGNYMTDKSMIPDTPAVIASVIYIAVVISIAALIIDIIYTFLDPRIKTKMKNY